MPVDLIAFDADDTLWHNERHYQQTQRELCDLLAPYTDADAVEACLYEVEKRNLPLFGYGAKGFTLSMIEAAVELSGGQVRGTDVQAIIDLGRRLAGTPVELLPGAAETVEALGQRYPLMLLTKGDLLDQERKIAESGLAGRFDTIEIVSNKTPETYASLLDAHGIDPAGFLMVGNSLRSDVLPVVQIGGRAVYIPYHVTWVHEQAPEAGEGEAQYHTLERIDELPALVERLDGAGG
jgi:putative hydrolase of the HAD superfamily